MFPDFRLFLRRGSQYQMWWLQKRLKMTAAGSSFIQSHCTLASNKNSLRNRGRNARKILSSILKEETISRWQRTTEWLGTVCGGKRGSKSRENGRFKGYDVQFAIYIAWWWKRKKQNSPSILDSLFMVFFAFDFLLSEQRKEKKNEKRNDTAWHDADMFPSFPTARSLNFLLKNLFSTSRSLSFFPKPTPRGNKCGDTTCFLERLQKAISMGCSVFLIKQSIWHWPASTITIVVLIAVGCWRRRCYELWGQTHTRKCRH